MVAEGLLPPLPLAQGKRRVEDEVSSPAVRRRCGVGVGPASIVDKCEEVSAGSAALKSLKVTVGKPEAEGGSKQSACINSQSTSMNSAQLAPPPAACLWSPDSLPVPPTGSYYLALSAPTPRRARLPIELNSYLLTVN